jgi:hypothetical protein
MIVVILVNCCYIIGDCIPCNAFSSYMWKEYSIWIISGHRPFAILPVDTLFPSRVGGYLETNLRLRVRGKGFVCLCTTCFSRTSSALFSWLAPYQLTLVPEPGPLGSGSNPLRYFHSIDNIPFDINSIFIYTLTSCSSFAAWSLWLKVRRLLTSKMPS